MKSLLAITLLCCSLAFQAQDWFPLEATWHYNYNFFGTTGYTKSWIDGDSTIKGQMCLRLRVKTERGTTTHRIILQH